MDNKLKEFAHIFAGYGFRGAIKPVKNGKIVIVQAKDLGFRDIADTSVLIRTDEEPTGYKQYLERNDILLVSRGLYSGQFRARLYKSEEKNIIASSSLHVIRVNSSKLLPDYLVQYLNSKKGQSKLNDIARGSYITAIPRKALEDMVVPIPPLDVQLTIINLSKTIQRQQEISNRKKEIQNSILDAVFNTLTK